MIIPSVQCIRIGDKLKNTCFGHFIPLPQQKVKMQNTERKDIYPVSVLRLEV